MASPSLPARATTGRPHLAATSMGALQALALRATALAFEKHRLLARPDVGPVLNALVLLLGLREDNLTVEEERACERVLRALDERDPDLARFLRRRFDAHATDPQEALR